MRTLKGEQGFSILEIIIATAILFFVLTAMLTVLNVSTTMSTKARFNGIATSLAQEQIEYARDIPYTQVGLTTPAVGEPTGTLLPTETTTAARLTFTITRDVVWVDDPADGRATDATGTDAFPWDYKRLTVRIAWNSAVSVGSVTLVSDYREPDEQGIPPNVEFVVAPLSSAIIYNPGAPGAPVAGADAVNHATGGIAYWRAAATESAAMDPSGGIASLTFYYDGIPMIRNHFASPENICSFVPGPSDDPMNFTAPAAPGFSIDTLTTDASGAPVYSEGLHEVRVETWDNSGLRDFRVRQLIIDNYAPSTAATCVATATPTDDGRYNSMTVSWATAMDGNQPAPRYRLYRNPYNGYGGGYYLTWQGSGTSVATSTLYNDDIAVGAPPYPTGAISVWDFYVQALSPAGWVSGARYIAQRQSNGPGLAGTVYEPVNNRRDVRVEWGDRSWNVSGTVEYDVAYSQSAPGGSPPNMFTNPGAGTTVINGVARSWGAGAYAPAPVGFSTATSSTAAWRTTWVTATAASPHWVWESLVQWRKQDPNPYSYVQVRARQTGGYYTGTVYSNVIGPKDSDVGAYADNPYAYY